MVVLSVVAELGLRDVKNTAGQIIQAIARLRDQLEGVLPEDPREADEAVCVVKPFLVRPSQFTGSVSLDPLGPAAAKTITFTGSVQVT